METEHAELVEMEAEIFSTYRFEDWSGYTVFWMIVRDCKVGSIAFVSDLTVGPSWDTDSDSPGTLWLVSIGVLPSFQSLGIGTEAMQWMIDWARSHDFQRLTSNFRFGNVASRRLHTKCGFRSVRVIPNYYPDPTEDAELVEIAFV
jgi:GNAT superfamily N-acetyltransferase